MGDAFYDGLLRQIGVPCDRCGKKCFDFQLMEIFKQYRRSFVVNVCEDCAIKANSFVNYYGLKKESDKENLRNYLASGVHAKEVTRINYEKLTQAGYYNETR